MQVFIYGMNVANLPTLYRVPDRSLIIDDSWCYTFRYYKYTLSMISVKCVLL